MEYADLPKLPIWKSNTSGVRKLLGNDPMLRELDGDIEKYGNSFSTMTKVNLLTDIQRSLNKLRSQHDVLVDWHPNFRALRAVVARKLGDLSPAPYAYTDVICIGWCIHTQQPSGGAERNKPKWSPAGYLQSSKNDWADMKFKCSSMMSAIESAATSVRALSIPDSAKTLKVFMAPEFYFRGANGAYSPEVISEIVGEMKTMGTGTDRYRHWLFVFGTAVCAYEYAEGDGTARVHNVALLQKGPDAHLIEKEYVSSIDYARDEVTIGSQTKGLRIPHDKTGNRTSDLQNDERFKATFNDERMGGCILTLDGMTIGLEVCLDHLYGRLDPYSDRIALHLLPSCGMNIKSYRCMVGGIGFNVDGVRADSEVFIRTGKKADKRPDCQQAGVPKADGSLDIWGPCPLPRL